MDLAITHTDVLNKYADVMFMRVADSFLLAGLTTVSSAFSIASAIRNIVHKRRLKWQYIRIGACGLHIVLIIVAILVLYTTQREASIASPADIF